MLKEVNKLVSTRHFYSFHNKCGTWFFTALLIPSQVQQLIDKKIGIKFITPNAEIEDNLTVSSEVQKKEREIYLCINNYGSDKSQSGLQ